MSESRKRAVETMRRKYGQDYFSRIGKKGGRSRAQKHPELNNFSDSQKASKAAKKRFDNPTLQH